MTTSSPEEKSARNKESFKIKASKKEKGYTLEITHLYIHVKPQVCVNRNLKLQREQSHTYMSTELLK